MSFAILLSASKLLLAVLLFFMGVAAIRQLVNRERSGFRSFSQSLSLWKDWQ